MFNNRKLFSILILSLLLNSQSSAQKYEDLDLLDIEDVELLKDDTKKDVDEILELSEIEEIDDLESLKSDIDDVFFSDEEKVKAEKELNVVDLKFEEDKPVKKEMMEAVIDNNSSKIVADKKESIKKEDKIEIFDVGSEEKELLELSKFIENKIPEREWDELASAAKKEKYEVQEGDYLWRISQNLFGSGFYYSKIWSLNPQITNPHEIEPGMTLVFDTGSSDNMPEVSLGEFADDGVKTKTVKFDYSLFGDGAEPNWVKERDNLIEQGVYFQYASDATYDDLSSIGKRSLTKEYQKYEPPIPDIIIREPGDEYDSTGFDKSSKAIVNIRGGHFLNTFIATNLVKDLGKIDSSQKESIFIQKYDRIYVKFDESAKVRPGDEFSIYGSGGKVTHAVTQRSGYKYTVNAQIKLLRPVNHVWECEVTDLNGLVKRDDRITTYTPKVSKIVKTYNKRNIEAAVIASFRSTTGILSYGDIIYIDRGRADGVEMGNVFDLYSFRDRGTDRKITPDPTYKIGELTVITLSDNFATAVISESSSEISYGTIALTKTQEAHARDIKVKNANSLKGVKEIEGKALEELDVELNLDSLSEDLLNKADQIRLSDDELDELERQEREKSILKEHERDLLELEKLEKEVIDAETSLNQEKVDEDRYLEQQNINSVEKKIGEVGRDALPSVKEVEEEIGLKFLDEDINSKENPYGLTEFDLEEIDELLNTGPL